MRRRVLLDTGPLVAFLNRNDHHHDWARGVLERIEPPLLCCEPVLSEACFLLRRLEGGAGAVLEMVQRGLVAVPFRVDQEAAEIERLLRAYSDVPMSLADACLVRMAEQHAGSAVLTVDSDFRVYRKHRRQVVPVLMP